MLYTENFKKEVVKKALSPGVIQRDICRKLKISETALRKWKEKYKAEVKNQIEEIDVAALLKEEEIDIDAVLSEAEKHEEEDIESVEEVTVDKIFSKIRKSGEYKTTEKAVILSAYRKHPKEESGIFLRRYGLHSEQLRLWEEEILSMGIKQIDKDSYIKKLEEENKRLQKANKNLERDKRELKFIIEIKKKHPKLFGADEES